ncbi:MAG: hypothetical protein A2787_07600 [Omnitrophica WOR_2 bacterium RIFCSPHIGHO2_01_FULL_48_9]|nr:MAG: hypothetical protein A3D10_02815 [Omnitrophica WOR_2 bacterium RIFCSPHIGHO2_02_FULL_48_11]OGX32684.1 MAG: hypothetical protein A2787_07600 [Omnitrophica WOR_2 bacterium RIFCSPHIGHO2_01_FULL_48_9]
MLIGYKKILNCFFRDHLFCPGETKLRSVVLRAPPLVAETVPACRTNVPTKAIQNLEIKNGLAE